MPVDQTVKDMISFAQQATLLNDDVVVHSGTGKAYQSVAQSAAIAIQDAADALRNVSTISTTASGVVIAQMLAGDESNSAMLETLQTLMKNWIGDFQAIGDAAKKVLSEFPH